MLTQYTIKKQSCSWVDLNIETNKTKTLTHNTYVFIVKDSLSSLLSTGWFQYQIKAWFHNPTKIVK